MWKPSCDILLSIRIRDDIDRLRFVLQWSNDIVQELLAVGKKWRDYVFACRTNGHAIGSFVIGAERKALPHRYSLGSGHSLAIIFGVLAVSNVLHPVVESAYELAVVVGVASRKVELAIGADRTGRAGGNTKLAFQARVIRDGMRIFRDFRID